MPRPVVDRLAPRAPGRRHALERRAVVVVRRHVGARLRGREEARVVAQTIARGRALRTRMAVAVALLHALALLALPLAAPALLLVHEFAQCALAHDAITPGCVGGFVQGRAGRAVLI